MMALAFKTTDATLGLGGALVCMLGVWLHAQAVAQFRADQHELAVKKEEHRADA